MVTRPRQPRSALSPLQALIVSAAKYPFPPGLRINCEGVLERAYMEIVEEHRLPSMHTNVAGKPCVSIDQAWRRVVRRRVYTAGIWIPSEYHTCICFTCKAWWVTPQCYVDRLRQLTRSELAVIHHSFPEDFLSVLDEIEKDEGT